MGLFGPRKKELKKEIERLQGLLLPEQQQIDVLNEQIRQLNDRKNSFEQAIQECSEKINLKNDEIAELDHEIAEKQKQVYGLENEIYAQEYGIYTPTYAFANSDLYKNKLTEVRQKQKEMIRDGLACDAAPHWTVNGNAAKGKKMVKDMQKLLLRAFNVECDNIVEGVRISNLDKSIERIYSTSSQISKLGEIMEISITNQYIELKIEEVKLALDFQQKKQEEKDRIKELKAQQREEAKAQKEMEEARKRLQKEKAHYQNALEALRQQIDKNGETEDLLNKKAELENELSDTEKAIEDVDYREANKRAGYVYIISNVGAFGENVYKIGMTRRLDPTERVDELGDASVPFDFDIHAMIFTEDAPKLESALHTAFEDRKINKVNPRREFFRVSLDEIKEVVRKNFDKTVEWIDIPEAEQYRQSLQYNQKK